MRPAKSFSNWLPIIIGVLAIAIGGAVSALLPLYLVYLAVTAVIATILLVGLGVVTGSAGMIALCQLTFAAVGAWVVSALNVANAPGGFLLWLILGGAAGAVAGVIIGLPALRLRGVNLAVVTLGFSAAVDATLFTTQFPGATDRISVSRPAGFSDDRSYLMLSILVLVVVAVVLHYLQRSRIGSGWRSVAFSERGTAAAGSSVRTSKLLAFAISASIAGLGGGLIAGQVGTAYPAGFTTIQSLALYVLAIVGGSHFVEMALVGGIIWVLVPELLKRFGIPQDWAFVVFGLFGIQALTTNSTLGQQIRNRIDLWRAGGSAPTATSETDVADVPELLPAPDSADPVLAIRALSVTFGALKALNDVTFDVRPGEIVGLIGPNGAGKSTLVDAVSGFLPDHEGLVLLDGESLNRVSPHKRARAGLRRTFQQDRVPPGLTVGRYVRFVSRGASTAREIDDILRFFGCPPAATRIDTIDIGTRRLIGVAANIAAKPRVLVLDEPTAGLSHEEHVAFGERLRTAPGRYNIAILLIEHDLDLVRSVCSSIAVLNFGEVLASGPQGEVLQDPRVLAAYMGETEML